MTYWKTTKITRIDRVNHAQQLASLIRQQIRGNDDRLLPGFWQTLLCTPAEKYLWPGNHCQPRRSIDFLPKQECIQVCTWALLEPPHFQTEVVSTGTSKTHTHIHTEAPCLHHHHHHHHHHHRHHHQNQHQQQNRQTQYQHAVIFINPKVQKKQIQMQAIHLYIRWILIFEEAKPRNPIAEAITQSQSQWWNWNFLDVGPTYHPSRPNKQLSCPMISKEFAC